MNTFARIAAAVVFTTTCIGASAQQAPPNLVSGQDDQVVTDVIVRGDGSQILVGYFSKELSIGMCPGAAPACSLASSAGGEDGFVAKIDAIAIATHGHGRVGRFAMGSVADKVIRSARIPVLTLRP